MTESTSQTSDRMQQAIQAQQRRKRRAKLILRGTCVFTVLAVLALILFFCRPEPREATLETVAETDSQSWLARIAMENGSEEVARAAVEKLTDPALLEQVAMSQTYPAAVTAALKLTQPDSLARVAQNSQNPIAKYIAILQITDQSVLERIARKRSRMSRVAALRLTDEQIARRVFHHANNWQVKLCAARAIDDPELLKIVALAVNTTNGENTTAVKLLEPYQVELEQVASQASNRYIRSDATKLLIDPMARVRLILKGKDYWRGSRRSDRGDLLRTVKDPKAMAMVANAKHLSSSLRRDAVEWLTDQATLAEIARSNFDPDVRTKATRRVTDPAVLRQLAQTKQGYQQRVAIGKITDVEFLKTLQTEHPRIVQQAASRRLEKLAAKKSTAPKSIKQIALADNRRNRIAAINRLADQKTLKRIAKNQKDPWDVRKAAMKGIFDQDWLMELYIWDNPAATKKYGFASIKQKFAVIYCMTDQKHLATIAIDPQCDKRCDKRVRDNLAWSAARRVTDPALAKRVLLESPHARAMFWGARYTTDPEALAQAGWKHIHKPNGRRDLFWAMAPKLEDRKLLLRIAIYRGTSGGPNPAELRLAELDRATPSPAK